MIARLLLLLVAMMLVTSAVLRNAKSAPPAGGLLVVANQKEHTLLVVDPDNRRELARIAVGVNGHEVIVSKDSRFAYVPIYGNSGVGKPGTDGSTIDVIDLPNVAYASAPTPDGRWLLAVSMVANRLFAVDLQTQKVAQSLEVPSGSSEILVRPGGEIAYISGTGAGKIAVLDMRSWKMQQSIDLTPGVDGLAWATVQR